MDSCTISLPLRMTWLGPAESSGSDSTLRSRSSAPRNLLLYVKDSAGAVIAKSDRPTIAFMIGERIMVNPLWTYLCEKAR